MWFVWSVVALLVMAALWVLSGRGDFLLSLGRGGRAGYSMRRARRFGFAGYLVMALLLALTALFGHLLPNGTVGFGTVVILAAYAMMRLCIERLCRK